MTLSRRSFLTESTAAGLFSQLLAHPELAHAVGTMAAKPSTEQTAGEVYWKELYATGTKRSRGGGTPDPNRDPRIALYDDKAGLRWAEDIKPTELPSFNEDAVVTMEMTGFRPGSEDTSKLAKVRFAQLHLSCQRVTGSEFMGPLVWAALATLFTSKASKLPSEQNLTFSRLTGQEPGPSQSGGPRLSHIVLNQGAGHMSVNITRTPINSTWDKILAGTVQTVKIMSPLLGFPGIALAGLQSFYEFYGQLGKELTSDFLLNGSQEDVAVTQQGADNSLISANSLKLISGNYILVPKSHEDDLQKEMDKLVIQNGYLVERDSKAAPDERVAQAIPAVSYVVLSVKVQKASDFPPTSTVTDPMLDSAPQGSDSSGAKHPETKKPH